MATEEEVKIKITADTSEFKKGMDEAVKSTEKLSKETGKSSGTKGFNAAMQETSKTTEGVKDKFKGIGKEGKKSGGILGKAFNGVKGKFMELGASSKLATAGAVGIAIAAVGIIGKMVVAIGKKVMQVSGQMAKMYDPAGFEKATNQMNASINKMKTSLGAVLEPVYKAMTGIVGGLADAFNGVLETVLKIYAAFVGFLGLSGTLSRDAEDYSDAMEEATASADAGLASFDKLNTLNTGDMGDAKQAENIRNMMADTAQLADSFRNSIAEALNPIKYFKDAFKNVPQIWNDFTSKAKASWDVVTKLGSSVWEDLSEQMGNIWGEFKRQFERVINWMRSAIANIINSIGNMIGNLAGNIGGVVGNAFGNLGNVLGNVFNAIKDKVEEAGRFIWNFYSGVWGKIFQTGMDVFGSLVEGIKGLFNNISFGNFVDGIVGGVKSALNGILSVWNNSIANIGFEISVPDWVPGIGGKKWGLNTYGWKIPYLATGSVVEPNDPFLAVVGDNTREREVISPISTIEEAVRNVIGENGTGQPIKIDLSVNLDGRKIARGTYDYLYAEAKRRGEAWH